MISKVLRSSSSTNLIKYIMSEEAHSKDLTNKRNLSINCQNVDTTYDGKYDSQYIASQYLAVQKLAKNKKKTQAYHLIFSFSDEEFPLPKNDQELNKQAQQAGFLISQFLKQYFPKNAQYVQEIQRDNDGKKLHAHVALNSVLTTGKVLDTRLLTWSDREKEVPNKDPQKEPKKVKIKGLKSHIDKFMLDNFEGITGRKYAPIAPRIDQNDNLVNSKEAQISKRQTGWKEQLKALIYDAFSASDSLETFKKSLKQNGVSVSEKRASTGEKDENGHKIYRKSYTYSFTDSDNKKRKIRDFSFRKNGKKQGLGLSFTPDNLQKEFENARNFKRKQLQEASNNAITELTKNIARSSRSDSRSIQQTASETEAKFDRRSEENSQRRTEKTDLASIRYDESREFEQEIRYDNNTAKNIDRFVKLSSSRPKRTASKIQLFKPNLAVLNAINKQFLDEQRNGRKQREKRKQELRKHERQHRKISNHNYRHFTSDRPENREISAGFSERQHEKTDEIENPNPFDDMF